MLRSGATRGFLRSLNATTNPALKTTHSPIRQQFRSKLCTASQRPQNLNIAKPLAPKTLALVRWQSTDGRKPVDSVDTDREARIHEKELKVVPEQVSTTSTISAPGGMTSPSTTSRRRDDDDTEMLAGMKSDLQTIRETFSLEEVPRQAYYMGMAGVLPYMATSLSTVYCAYEIQHAAATGSGILMSEHQAELLLHLIEPLQVGYGAVIISFLGAIHWGLEWAKYGGEQGYSRYFIGVFSTALAWPTILLPVEYALISQFLVFNFLYYTDSRASKRGWAPPWYGVYRFVLTFIVGGSIVVSLIGRGQVADRVGKLPGVAEKMRQMQEQMARDEPEEDQDSRAKFLPDESEGGEEEEEDDE